MKNKPWLNADILKLIKVRVNRESIKQYYAEYFASSFNDTKQEKTHKNDRIDFFFNTDHPLQGFRSHCSVRGYSSLLVATAEAEATTRTGRQHTHAHTQPPTQPFITSKHDMKSLLVREQVDGSTVLVQKLSTSMDIARNYYCL